MNISSFFGGVGVGGGQDETILMFVHRQYCQRDWVTVSVKDTVK